MLVVPIALLLGLTFPGYWVTQWVGAARHWVPGLLLIPVASLPWWVPLEQTLMRFFLALGALLALARLTETWLGHAPLQARQRWRDFAAYFLSIGDLVFSSSSADERAARRTAWLRVARGSAKALALGGCFALNSWLPSLHASAPLHFLWCLFAAYWAASAVTDFLSALLTLTTGHTAQEVFQTPPFATSPRDFWSRRWNMMFRNTAHRLIFTPLGGSARPVRGVIVVFLFSALVHEYLVLATLGHTQGHMLAFFTLHGLATLACGLRRRPWPMPRWLAVLFHNAWLLCTAPLFFAPLERILPARHWQLW